jgi:hypothetical protein
VNDVREGVGTVRVRGDDVFAGSGDVPAFLEAPEPLSEPRGEDSVLAVDVEAVGPRGFCPSSRVGDVVEVGDVDLHDRSGLGDDAAGSRMSEGESRLREVRGDLVARPELDVGAIPVELLCRGVQSMMLELEVRPDVFLPSNLEPGGRPGDAPRSTPR